MTYFYYNINKIDKDIFANIYIKIIEELTAIFNIIPYNKITGPPDEFPYFDKVINYIYNIIQLFDGNNIFFDSILNNNSKNNNYIINTLESIITDDFSKSNSKNFIIKLCKLSDIIEELYTICNFFQFKIIYLNPICNKANYYEKIEHNDCYYEIETLTNKDKINEYIMTHIRTSIGMDKKYFKQNMDNIAFSHFKIELSKLEAQKLLKINGSNISLTESGMLISDSISENLFLI